MNRNAAIRIIMTNDELIADVQRYLDDETIYREQLRRAFSAILMDTSEENPLEVDITVEPRNWPGCSSLEAPELISLYQDPTEGWIYFTFYGLRCDIDFDDMDLYELLQIFEELTKDGKQIQLA